MTKSSELTIFLHIGYGSDPLSIIPYPGPQLIHSVLSLYRIHAKLQITPLPPYPQKRFAVSDGIKTGNQCFFISQRLSVYRFNIIAGL